MSILITKKIKSIEVVKNNQQNLEKEVIKEIVTRPKVLDGKTYRLKSPLSESALYITINHVEIDDKKYPFEIFINTKSLEHQQWIITLTRLISAIFRQHTTFHTDISFMIRELKSVFDPNGGYLIKNRRVPSLVAEIGDIIETRLIELGTITDYREDLFMSKEEIEKKNLHINPATNIRECPNCANISLIKADGCDICTTCGYSKCL